MKNFEIINYENNLFEVLYNLFLSFVKERNIENALSNDEIGNNLFDYLEYLDKKYVYLIQDKENKKVVGFLIGKIKKRDLFYLKSYDKGSISYFYVLPEFRGFKLASLLKNRFIDDLKEIGIKEIGLKCKYDNDLAKKIYNKWGFEEGLIIMNKNI